MTFSNRIGGAFATKKDGKVHVFFKQKQSPANHLKMSVMDEENPKHFASDSKTNTFADYVPSNDQDQKDFALNYGDLKGELKQEMAEYQMMMAVEHNGFGLDSPMMLQQEYANLDQQEFSYIDDIETHQLNPRSFADTSKYRDIYDPDRAPVSIDAIDDWEHQKFKDNRDSYY